MSDKTLYVCLNDDENDPTFSPLEECTLVIGSSDVSENPCIEGEHIPFFPNDYFGAKRLAEAFGWTISLLNGKVIMVTNIAPNLQFGNSYKLVDDKGNVKYYKDRAKTILHNVNGAAVEYSFGGKEWWINGKLHREDGPAIEVSNGSKLWYYNGVLHRKNGPAIELSDGSVYFYVNGEQVYDMFR